MVDYLKVLGKLQGIAWRRYLAVLGTAFLSASLLSTILANFLLQDGAKMAGRPAAKGATGQSVSLETAGSLSQASVDAILKRNIFNSEGSLEDETQRKNDQTPTTEAIKSDLPVKLLGTIYGGDPYSGIAIISNTAKQTVNSFMVNDSLLKEAVIKEVHRERVILERNNRLEYIDVEKQEIVRSRRKKKTGAPAAVNGVAPIATEPPPSHFKEEGFERKEREISMSQSYRQKLLTTDFTKVLQDAKATPNMVDGELRGFHLSRIRKDSIYEKAGLQNDDVIEEINGVPLTDTAQAIRLLQSLRNEAEIEVRIKRGGAPMRFNLNVN